MSRRSNVGVILLQNSWTLAEDADMELEMRPGFDKMIWKQHGKWGGGGARAKDARFRMHSLAAMRIFVEAVGFGESAYARPNSIGFT